MHCLLSLLILGFGLRNLVSQLFHDASILFSQGKARHISRATCAETACEHFLPNGRWQSYLLLYHPSLAADRTRVREPQIKCRQFVVDLLQYVITVGREMLRIL